MEQHQSKTEGGAAVRSSDGLDAVTRTLIADLMTLYSARLPCGDWEGSALAGDMIKDRLQKLGWTDGKAPEASNEVMNFLASRQGV